MKNKDSILETAHRVIDIEAEEVINLKSKLTDDFVGAVNAILSCSGKVVVCGMGKSGHIAKKIAATLASTGTSSFFLHPAEAFHGDLGMLAPQDVFIGISNSGETEEVIRLIPSVQRNNNPFVAICGNRQSTLAKNADFFLDISVEKEACPLELAPTSSTTATLVMGDALAMALMEQRNFQPENFALFHPGGSLGRKLLTKVSDAMRKDSLPLLESNRSLQELIYAMSAGKLGLAMITENKKLVGVVTDGDLRRAWQKHGSIQELSISDLMTRHPKTISPEMKLAEAEELIRKFKITTLIVETNHIPVGVLQVYGIE